MTSAHSQKSQPALRLLAIILAGFLHLPMAGFAEEKPDAVAPQGLGVGPIRQDSIATASEQDFRDEQRRMEEWQKSKRPDSALALARLYNRGVLVKPGNPLRWPEPQMALAALEPFAALGGPLGTDIRIERAKLLLNRAEPGDVEAALTLLEKAVKEGTARAKFELGDVLEAGKHAPRDVRRAERLLREAFFAGETRAMDGLLRLSSDRVERDDLARRRMVLLAGQAETSGWAAAALAVAYLQGEGVASDPQKAIRFTRLAVRSGQGNAALDLHKRFSREAALSETLLRDEADLLREAALRGSVEAARALAQDFAAANRLGIGPDEGRYWLEALSETGDGPGTFLFLKLLRAGGRLPTDPALANRVLDQLVAFARTRPALAHRFALELVSDDSPFQDPSLAETLLAIAVEAGQPLADRQLAELILFGLEAPDAARAKKALALLAAAGQAGDIRASILEARAYSRGRGVGRDVSKALAILDALIERSPVAEAFLARGKLFAQQGGSDQPLSVPDLEKAASLHSLDAMVELARLYRLGRAVRKDRDKAIGWLEKAIHAGHRPARKLLADLLREAVPSAKGPADMDRAVALYEQAIAEGDASAALALGDLLVEQKNTAKASSVYAKLAEIDIPLGKAALATLLSREGASSEALRLMKEAIAAMDQSSVLRETVAAEMLVFPDAEISRQGAALLIEAAKGGAPGAMDQLAAAYWSGRGVARNAALALDYADQAARRGRTKRLEEFGEAYATGRDVARDPAQAQSIRLRLVEIEPDNAEARYDLAKLLLDGESGPEDAARGAAELLEAVRLGHLGAQLRLARQIVDGDRKLGTRAEAIDLLEDAARRGSTEAAVELGRLLLSGDIGFVDPDRARFWYERAADTGSSEARLELARMPLSGLLAGKDEASGLAQLAALGETGMGEADAERARYYFATAVGKNAEQRNAFGLEALRKAAEAGEAESMFQLSSFYRRGFLVAQDGALARLWLERAASAGHAFSKSLLNGDSEGGGDEPSPETADAPGALEP